MLQLANATQTTRTIRIIRNKYVNTAIMIPASLNYQPKVGVEASQIIRMGKNIRIIVLLLNYYRFATGLRLYLRYLVCLTFFTFYFHF